MEWPKEKRKKKRKKRKLIQKQSRPYWDYSELGLLFPPVQMTAVSSRVTSFKKKTGQFEEDNCPLLSCLKTLESYIEDEFYIVLHLTCVPAWGLKTVCGSQQKKGKHTHIFPSLFLLFSKLVWITVSFLNNAEKLWNGQCWGESCIWYLRCPCRCAPGFLQVDWWWDGGGTWPRRPLSLLKSVTSSPQHTREYCGVIRTLPFSLPRWAEEPGTRQLSGKGEGGQLLILIRGRHFGSGFELETPGLESGLCSLPVSWAWAGPEPQFLHLWNGWNHTYLTGLWWGPRYFRVWACLGGAP